MISGWFKSLQFSNTRGSGVHVHLWSSLDVPGGDRTGVAGVRKVAATYVGGRRVSSGSAISDAAEYAGIAIAETLTGSSKRSPRWCGRYVGPAEPSCRLSGGQGQHYSLEVKQLCRGGVAYRIFSDGYTPVQVSMWARWLLRAYPSGVAGRRFSAWCDDALLWRPVGGCAAGLRPGVLRSR